MPCSHSDLPQPAGQPWDSNLYQDRHAFVWQLGSSLVELLAPRPGERILDLGCGTGQLTARIAQAGAAVVGLDNAPAMIEAARRQYPELRFEWGDAHDFAFTDAFDAVFSNAALHWVQRPADVVACVSRALRPGGRFVAEFGGKGNVRHLVAALEEASRDVARRAIAHPWYFPGVAEFASLLDGHGLEVTQALLFDRPTPLEGEEGMRNWVRMFGQHWLEKVPADRHDAFLSRVEELARPHLYKEGSWYADYRRLRVVAWKERQVGGSS